MTAGREALVEAARLERAAIAREPRRELSRVARVLDSGVQFGPASPVVVASLLDALDPPRRLVAVPA